MSERRGGPVTSSVRWGIPDAVWAFVGGLAGAILAAVPFSRHDISAETATFLAATFIGQYGATVLVLVLISHRKGLGTLAADFGLRIRLSDAWMLGGGLVLGGALGLFLAPLSSLAGGKEQAVVQQLNNSSGPKLVVLAIGAGAIAPIVEELLFRGLLLRALLRRVQAPAAVAISATAFGLVHVLLDPSIGSVVALPGLTAVGMVSGVLAVRSGDLSRSIFLHAGFNALAILQVVVS